MPPCGPLPAGPAELLALSITSIHLEEGWPVSTPGRLLGKQGTLWPSDQWACAQILPKDDPKYRLSGTRAGESLGSHVQPQGGRRTRQPTAITSQMCICSQPGRSRRGI